MIFAAVAGFLAGTAGSMGLGGGSVLLLYLTLFAGTEQLKAQGMNLIFFIPCAIFALILYIKSGLIQIKPVLLTASTGIIGAVLGTLLGGYIGQGLLSKLLAVFLLYMGISEIYGAFRTKKSDTQNF